MHKHKDNPYHQLTQQERYHLNALIETGFSVREAAKRLNRHHSTVYRELRRNSIEGVSIPEEAVSVISRLRRRKYSAPRNSSVARSTPSPRVAGIDDQFIATGAPIVDAGGWQGTPASTLQIRQKLFP